MTAREMHIEVNQSLQKVAANTTRKFLNEEIDWVLNKMQDRFIQLSLIPKLNSQGRPTGAFTVNQLRQDALRNITVTGKEIVTDITDNRKCKAILPADYSFLLADQSLILTNCGSDKQNTTNVNLLLIKLPAHTGSGPYFTDLVITIGTTSLSIPTDLDLYHSYTSLKKKEDISLLVPYILYRLRKAGVQAYWERYGSTYEQNTIIVPNGTTSTLSYSGVLITGNTSTKSVSTKTSGIVSTGIKSANRLEESAKIFELLQTSFYKPTIQSPISELESNILSVHTDTSFIVTKVILNYIRKPKPISLILGSNCEIAEEFHQTICDLTVEYLKGRTEHPEGLSLISNDIENRVIL